MGLQVPVEIIKNRCRDAMFFLKSAKACIGAYVAMVIASACNNEIFFTAQVEESVTYGVAVGWVVCFYAIKTHGDEGDDELHGCVLVAGEHAGVGDNGEPSGLMDDLDSIFHRELLTIRIGWAVFSQVQVKGFSIIFHKSLLYEKGSKMGTTNLPITGNGLDLVPGDVDFHFLDVGQDLEVTDLTGVLDFCKILLQGGVFVVDAVAQNMHRDITMVGAEFYSCDDFNIMALPCRKERFKTFNGVVVCQGNPCKIFVSGERHKLLGGLGAV